MDTAVVPAPTVLTAEAAVREARIKLLSARQSLINLGLPVPADDFKGLTDEQVSERLHFLGIAAGDTRTSIHARRRTICCRFDPRSREPSPRGTSLPAKSLIPTKMLFEVVDNSIVWLTVGVRNEDVPRLRLNQTKVIFEPDGLAKSIEGVIAWISSEADHKTRTVRVRVNLDNKDARLRANTFGHGQVDPAGGRERRSRAE